MLDVEHYQQSAHLFIRLLGVIYFFAFGAFLFQINGLVGSSGILPADRFFGHIKNRILKPYLSYPSLFWFNCSDPFLFGVIALGTTLSLLLAFGIFPPLMLLLLYVLYLSVITIGQDFLSFGWEMFLMEITVNAFFLSLTSVPNPLVWISINLLLFRFHFQGGVVKLQSGDPNWRNLTGIAYHYESQPLPNTIAWYVHKAPLWFHKFSCFLMLFIEIAVPFALFFTHEARLVVYILLVGLQFFIWLTGNFSYLNHLTVAFCTLLLSDFYLSPLLGWKEASPTPLALDIFLTAVGGILLFLQVISLSNHFFLSNKTFRKILYACKPFHLANRYGIFAVMTTKRIEIVIEGSEDGVTWKEYKCFYKPSEVTRRPRRISPYQPRLDWQMWFLPFTSYEEEIWFQNFLLHLLLGTPQVLALLRENPFPEKPPFLVRALAYEYVFSDRKLKKDLGYWWSRTLVGEYSPILSLKRKAEE